MVEDAMVVLADRLRARHEELAREIVALYTQEIVDYAASSEEFLEKEVLTVTRTGLTHLLDNIAANRVEPTERQLEDFRRMLTRRPHQGIALPAIQEAFRLFGQHFHEQLARCAEADDPEELLAVIRCAAVILRFSHATIGVVTQAYLDELEDVGGDREIVSRSLLDAVLTGRASSPATRRDARILGIDLVPENVVLVARAPLGAEQRPRTLRAAAKALRTELLRHVTEGRALVGVREGEVVAVCPAPKPTDAVLATDAAHAVAEALDELGMSIGVSSRQVTAEAVPGAYAEAREAADIAIRTGVHGQAVVYDDVLVDHVLRSSESAGRVIAAALGPLREYDERRQADLVDTLRAYIDANFSITRAGRALHVHNNTVLYRLGRVRELTGRDPRNPRDIVFLALSLRLNDEPS